MHLIAGILLITVLVVGGLIFGTTISLAYSLISGLIVGVLARAVLPGRERIGLLGTALVGLAGGAIGGFIGRALHVSGLMELVFSVAAAAVLLSVLGYREKKR